MTDDKSGWISSHELARKLLVHRNNDVKVNADGNWVPVADAYYDSTGDAMVIELVTNSEDYRITFVDEAIAREVME